VRALLLLLLLAHSAAAQVVPSRYDITLVPDAEASRFSGHERIDVELQTPTALLRLDAVGLDVREARIVVGGQRLRAAIRREAEAVVLCLPQPVPAGSASIELVWRGKMASDQRGMFVARGFVVTHFEPDGARRVFPSFDQPALRARFKLRAVVPAGELAVSNGAVVGETVHEARGTKTVDFAETPPLPTYLVALTVGRYDVLVGQAGDVPLRILAPAGRGPTAAAALAAVPVLLARLEQRFGVAYPFDKLDVVAVPALPVHGMENAACVFVPADELLLDEHPALEDEQRMMHRLAHELSHQWFGDLVTMASWRDLWLSEAVSRWSEIDLLDELHPEWTRWRTFGEARARALAMDARLNSHAVRNPTPRFDDITYNKGAAVLRMLEQWIGRKQFTAALHDYLAAHRFGAASAEDLWRAIAAHAGSEVAEVGRRWLDQPGHPTLEVETRCADGALQIRLGQRRDLAGHVVGRVLWPLPLELRTPDTTLRLVLRNARESLWLREAGGCARTLHTDGDLIAPFRVRYSRWK
jgi:aminopeptidase N